MAKATGFTRAHAASNNSTIYLFPPLLHLRSLSGRCRTRHPTLQGTRAASLASLVPDFVRLFDTTGSRASDSMPRLPGFNVNDTVSIFLSDLIHPSNAYAILLLFSCTVAFCYWEGGVLLQELLQEKELENLEDEYLSSGGIEKGADSSEDAAEMEKMGTHRLTEQALRSSERKRALGWLALVVALSVWCTGAVNKLNPFQP